MLYASIITTILFLLLAHYGQQYSEHNRRSRGAIRGWQKRRRNNAREDSPAVMTRQRVINIYRGSRLVDTITMEA
jgi:hypothetical protein